ncbi:unnamed protein product, partial [marine sediment metagenome]
FFRHLNPSLSKDRICEDMASLENELFYDPPYIN